MSIDHETAGPVPDDPDGVGSGWWEAATVELPAMRGHRLVWTGWLVWRARAAAGWRRTCPRLARHTTHLWARGVAAGRWSARQLGGVAVAVALALWLWGRPIARSWAASPRWAHAAGALAARLRARKVTTAGLVLLALGALMALWAPILAAVLLAPGLVWAATRTAMAYYPHTTRGRVRTRFQPPRAPGASQLADGFAPFWELHRHLSAHAARQVTAIARPTLAATLPAAPVSREQARALGPGAAAAARARRLVAIEGLPVAECGTWLGRSAVGPVLGTEVWVPHRDVVGLYAPPQTGKTSLLGHHILDHPGAVVSTSTKVELYAGTAALRAGRGRVRLFNPERLGGIRSTLRWSPVAGCANGRVARQRAAHLIGAAQSSGEDSGLWTQWGTSVLAALLMAADRAGEDMTTVAHWVFTQRDGAERAVQLLRAPGVGAVLAAGVPVSPLVIDALTQVTTTEAKRTRDSIFMTMRAAVGFMADPDVAAICCPTGGDDPLDVARFITGAETLYLVGSKDGEIAPLLAALTGYLFETAKALAADYPGERLDPPLKLVLDEVALICPVPLPAWLADAGGRGISVEWAAQSPSQLAETWGERGAATIEDCTNALVVFGGLKVDRDLERVSKLCGQRQELVHDPDGSGPGRPRMEWRPVVPADRVRTNPLGHVLVLHRSTPPTITRFTPYEQRRDVRRTRTTNVPADTPAGPGPAAGGLAGGVGHPGRRDVRGRDVLDRDVIDGEVLDITPYPDPAIPAHRTADPAADVGTGERGRGV